MNTLLFVRKQSRPELLASILPVALAVFSGPPAAMGATKTIENCNDNGNGSLRQAILEADSGDTIDLSALSCSIISVTTGEISVAADNLALLGPGTGKLTIQGGAQQRHEYAVFHHQGAGTFHLSGLQITDPNGSELVKAGTSFCINSNGNVFLDRANLINCAGGGIFAAHGATVRYANIDEGYQGLHVLGGDVTIESSTISHHTYAGCSALFIGTLTAPGHTSIRNSTVSNNSAFYYSAGAGCIYQPAVISNSTIADNRSSIAPGGFSLNSAQVTIESSIFANSVSNGGETFDLVITSPAISGHNNLITAMPAQLAQKLTDTIAADPQLMPLADNGGPTPTRSLAATSPAIDAGNNSSGLTADQRGAAYPRVSGARADIGAFETQASAPPNFAINPGITGSWFDPTQSGMGLMVEVLPGSLLYVSWLAFDADGRQAWFTGIGTYHGNVAEITQTWQPQGARWTPNFHASDIRAVPWGTLTFTFSDCEHGAVDFSSSITGFGSGHMDLTRLTLPSGLSCP